MIHEFALDPRILNRWEAYDRFVNDCGVEQGRLIADFPNRWRRMVMEAVDRNSAVTPVERQRIEFHLQHRVEPKLMTSNRRYDFPDLDWLGQAEREHNSGKTFHAIVTDENPRGHPKVLLAEELDRDHDPLWRVTRSETIARTPAKFAEISRTLFKISRHVRLVDPHFKPEARRYQEVLESLLSALRASNHPVQAVEFHLTVGKDRTTQIETPRSAFEQGCRRFLPGCIPAGLKLSLFRWKERHNGERLHARSILTDRGGIGIEGGLDAGHPGQTTQVYLLTKEQRDKQWSAYDHSRPFGAGQEWSLVFEPESGGPVIVTGTRH